MENSTGFLLVVWQPLKNLINWRKNDGRKSENEVDQHQTKGSLVG